MSIFSVLVQPYPNDSPTRERWLLCYLAGAIVTAFLYTFEPFGFGKIEGIWQLWHALGYGMVTICATALSTVGLPLLLPNIFAETNWVVWKEIAHTALDFVLIGLFNAVYSSLAFSEPFTFDLVWGYQYVTLTVGVIPATIIILLSNTYRLQRHLKQAQTLNKELVDYHHTHQVKQELPEQISFLSESQKEQFAAEINEIICIESVGNYLEINYCRNESAQKHVLRNRLKYAEELLQNHPQFLRCHRAFVVNLHYVENVEGNSQGYKLTLRHLNFTIPVARSKSKDLSLAMKN